MNKRLSKETRKVLEADPRMTFCAYCGTKGTYENRVEWHHINIMGRRLDDPRFIQALCRNHHRGVVEITAREKRMICFRRLAETGELEQARKDYPKVEEFRNNVI